MNKDKLDRITEDTDEIVSEEIDGTSSAGNDNKKKKFNIIPKIICLFFAVVIWYYVMQVDSPSYRQEFSDIPVTLKNREKLESKGLTVFTGDSYSVDITVNGKKSVISKYNNEDIKVEADLKKYVTPGLHEVRLNVSLPNGLTLSENDYFINVFVDEKVSAKVPVLAKATGATLSNDYSYGTLVAEYPEITVKGPKTIVDKIDHAVVTADYSNAGILESTVSTDGTITLENANGDIIFDTYLKTDYITMKVTYPVYIVRELPLTVAYKNGLYNDSNVKIEINPSTVRIKGEASAISKLTSVTLATIDEKEIENDKTLTFELTPNEDFSFADSDSFSADVTITNIDTVTRMFRVDKLSASGSNASYEIKDPYVDVTLRGPAAKLEKIKAEDIKLTADIADFDDSIAGEIEVDAAVTIAGNPAGVYEIGHYKLTINVMQ